MIHTLFKWLAFIIQRKEKTNNIDLNKNITIESTLPYSEQLFLSHFNFKFIQDDSIDDFKIIINCKENNKNSIIFENNRIFKNGNIFVWKPDLLITIIGKLPKSIILNNFASLDTDNVLDTNEISIHLDNDSKISIHSIKAEKTKITSSTRSIFQVNSIESKDINIEANNGSSVSLLYSLNSKINLGGNSFKFQYRELNNSLITIGEYNQDLIS